MNKVKIEKKKLLETLKFNRTQHEKIFNEAHSGYVEESIKLLKYEMKKAKKGEKFTTYIHITEPLNKIKDYDKIISMVDMHNEDIVELDSMQFSQYVLDDWDWKEQFTTSNSMYLKSNK